MPLIPWALAAAAGWLVLDKAGDAAEQSAKLAKWAVAGGALYLAYRALKASGR